MLYFLRVHLTDNQKLAASGCIKHVCELKLNCAAWSAALGIFFYKMYHLAKYISLNHEDYSQIKLWS